MKRKFFLVLFIVTILTFSSLEGTFKSISYADDNKKLVLLELFTAEWCPPCGKVNPEVDALYDESGGKDFLLIKFHLSDDMVCPLSEDRARKYRVEGIPTLVVDGKDNIVGSADNYKSKLKEMIQKAKGEKTNTSLEINGSIKSNQLNGSISFAGAPKGAKLIIVLVEDFYYYRASNGEIFHRFLARTGSINSIESSGKQNFNFELQNNWAKEMLRCIAFIEDSDGTIQNSTYSSLGIPEPDLNKAIISVTPNEIQAGLIKEGEKIKGELLATNAGKTVGVLKLESKENYISFSNNSVSVSPKTQSRISFTIDATGLTPKVYTANITITSQNYSKEIPLKFEILPKPSLNVDTQTLDFGKVKKGEKPRLSFKIKNNNRGTIKGTISTNDDWLVISKKNFDDEELTVNVTALTKDLPQGKSEGKINIKSDGGNASIIVYIEIAAPKIELNPSIVDFGEVEINSENFEKEVFVTNSGDIETTVQITSSPEFVKVSENKFSLDSLEKKEIKITLIKNKLKVNTKNEGSIIFEYSDEEKIELKVSVYPIEPPPVLSILSDYILNDKISVSLKKGEKIKIEIELKNDGGSILEGKIEIEPNANWVTLSLKSFSIASKESKKLNINLDSSNLNPGKYETNLKFTSNVQEKKIPLIIEVIRDKIVIELKIGSNKATVSGKVLVVDPPPYIKNGTTLVPLRFISEAFGAEVEWQPNVGNGTVIIKFESKLIQVEINNAIAVINGIPTKLPVPPEIKNGRTFVPIRFISEAFGAEVEWIASEQKVIIVL